VALIDHATRLEWKNRIVDGTKRRISDARLYFEEKWSDEFEGTIVALGAGGEPLFTVGVNLSPARIDTYVETHGRGGRRTPFWQSYDSKKEDRQAGQLFADAVTREANRNLRPLEADQDLLQSRIASLIERDGQGAAEAIALAIAGASPTEIVIAITDAMADTPPQPSKS
jgi:hypothetical protein